MTTPAEPGAPEGATEGQQDAAPGAQGIGQPTQPTEGQLPKPQQGQQQAPGAPEPKTADGKPETQDVSSLPDWAQKLIKDARNDAAKARTGAKQQAAEEARQQLLADFAAKLGLTPEGEPTADELNTQLQQQLEQYQTEIEELQASQTEATFQGYIRDTAAEFGLDAKMLAGWQNFRDEVEAELEEEFTDDDLKAAVAKVAKTYQGRPQFAAQTGAPRSGAPMPGAPTQQPKRPRSLTEALGRAYGQGAR